jgi:endonuclease IV
MRGIHVVKGNNKTIEDALKNNLNAGWTSAQIFTHGPRNKQFNNINVQHIKKLISEYNITLYVHSSYPTSIFGTQSKPRVNSVAVDHLVEQSLVANMLRAPLVVHLPRRDVNLVVDALLACEQAGSVKNNTILLEMPAMKPDRHSFETAEKIQNLLTTMENSKLRGRYGICLDTAHVWAAGVNLTNYNYTKSYLEELNKLMYHNYKALQLLHVNGTSVKLGGGRDIHIVPGAKGDEIWGNIPYRESGLRAILEFAQAENIDIIYEVKEGRTDFGALDILKKRY